MVFAKVRGVTSADQPIHPLPRVPQQLPDSGLHMFGANLIKRDFKVICSSGLARV